MKISDKIIFLVLVLTAALTANTFMSLRRVSDLGEQLRQVAEKDIVLTDIGNAVTRNYLENAIRFQSLLNIGDELAFAQMPASRRQYLLSHIKDIKKSFGHVTQLTGQSIMKGKDLIRRELGHPSSPAQSEQTRQTGQCLEKIETAYVEYDALFNEMYKMISAGGFELSLDDLGRVHQKEKALSDKITSLLSEIRQGMERMLNKASRDEVIARRELFIVLISIVILSLLTAVLLIQSFSAPLKALILAAQQIGQGNFKVTLDTKRRDEIGEVSAAFDIMTRRLEDFKTEIEKKNEELRKNLALTSEQKRDLEKINTELDRFVYTVSHDIAAPLTGIEGYGAFLEQHYLAQLDEKGQRSLNGLRKATKRMNDMIKDLLALTRISRIKNPYEKVDLRELINNVLERLEYVIREKRCQIIMPEVFPQIVCDRVKLAEILYNLINNAIKFSSGKENDPRIEIGYLARPDSHEFYVRDNGCGIPAEHHQVIFDVFKRLDNAADLEGTGAGLSIVKAGVEDHGGKVWVESREAEGATFRFIIPNNLKATLSKLIVS